MSSVIYRVCVFSVTSLILGIGALAGAGVWQSNNDIFTLSPSYGFYWFMCILTIIIGALGCIATVVPFVRNTLTKCEVNDVAIGIFLVGVSFVGSVCWLATFASIAKLCSDCVYIKDKYLRYYTLVHGHNCHGQIVSTTFGGLLFLLWGGFLVCNGVLLYKSTLKKDTPPHTAVVSTDMNEMQEVISNE